MGKIDEYPFELEVSIGSQPIFRQTCDLFNPMAGADALQYPATWPRTDVIFASRVFSVGVQKAMKIVDMEFS